MEGGRAAWLWLGMEDAEPMGPPPHLDLDNFEEKHHQDCLYVLTSPRSLAACARLGVRPVELLPRPLEALTAEEAPPQAQLAELYEARERKRRVRLRRCREERRRLQAQEGRDQARYAGGGLRQSEGSKAEGAKAGAEMAPEKKEPPPGRKRPSQPEVSAKSISLEDLRHQSEADRKLCQLAAQIEREAHVVMPQRDKKIAALMLAKHQGEQELEQFQIKTAQAWEAVLRSEVHSRKQMDVVFRARPHQRLEGQQQDLAKQRTWQIQESNLTQALKEQELSHGNHHLMSKTEQKYIRQKAERSKRFQELRRWEREAAGKVARERNEHCLHQRISRALQAKAQREAYEQHRLHAENEQAKLRHSSLKEQADAQTLAEELLKRLSLEHKTQKTTEAYEHLLEERNRELRLRAAREEQQIQQAQIRAELQQQELYRHKWQLVQNSESKIQQARKAVVRSMKEKAFRAHEENTLKEQVHHILKKRVAEEEENHRREVEHTIRIKDKKSDQIMREKEAILEKSRKVARASFQMREKVREQTKSRTFDQMVFEAQLSASIIKDVN